MANCKAQNTFSPREDKRVTKMTLFTLLAFGRVGVRFRRIFMERWVKRLNGGKSHPNFHSAIRPFIQYCDCK